MNTVGACCACERSRNKKHPSCRDGEDHLYAPPARIGHDLALDGGVRGPLLKLIVRLDHSKVVADRLFVQTACWDLKRSREVNMQSTGTDADRNIAPVYLVLNGEMMLDSPTQESWLHVIDFGSWNNFPILRHISGEPGQEGEVVLLKKVEKGFDFPAYYCRTIKLDPERRVIWKTYPETKTEEDDFFGIVDFRVYDEGGKTRFCYNTLYEFLVRYRSEGELDAFRKRQSGNFDALLSVTLPKLKALCEKR